MIIFFILVFVHQRLMHVWSPRLCMCLRILDNCHTGFIFLCSIIRWDNTIFLCALITHATTHSTSVHVFSRTFSNTVLAKNSTCTLFVAFLWVVRVVQYVPVNEETPSHNGSCAHIFFSGKVYWWGILAGKNRGGTSRDCHRLFFAHHETAGTENLGHWKSAHFNYFKSGAGNVLDIVVHFLLLPLNKRQADR